MNAIGTQLADLINLGMAYGGLNKYMDAAAELGRNPESKHQVQPEYHMEMSRLTNYDLPQFLQRKFIS